MTHHNSSIDSLDNDQRERLILAVVVDAPERNIRKVEILSNCKTEKIVLFLRRGDGYAMNGKMQKYYTHGVPESYEVVSHACAEGRATATATSSKESEQQQQRRISIVFRYGKEITYTTDSGKPCHNLIPAAVYRDKRPWFGSLRGLYEGWVYSRSDIWHMGAHGSQQKGVSGNKTEGCDAIVVAGKGEVKGTDTLFELTYSACTCGKGAEGMIISKEMDLVLRVFRTEHYNHVNRAVVPANAFYKRISGTYYRYDGLYKIKSYRKGIGTSDGDGGRGEEYVFELVRCCLPQNVFDGENYRMMCRGIGTMGRT
jgi:SAD/SRA domain